MRKLISLLVQPDLNITFTNTQFEIGLWRRAERRDQFIKYVQLGFACRIYRIQMRSSITQYLNLDLE